MKKLLLSVCTAAIVSMSLGYGVASWASIAERRQTGSPSLGSSGSSGSSSGASLGSSGSSGSSSSASTKTTLDPNAFTSGSWKATESSGSSSSTNSDSNSGSGARVNSNPHSTADRSKTYTTDTGRPTKNADLAAGNSNSNSQNKASGKSGSEKEKEKEKESGKSEGGSCGGSNAWQVGGLSTNQTSSGMADAQKAMTYALATLGLVSNAATFTSAMMGVGFPGVVVSEGAWPVIPPTAGVGVDGTATTWFWNTDFMGVALDGTLLYDSMHKKAVLSEPVKDLEATSRNIGSPEDLEGECEGDTTGECNETNAILDGSEVHVSTLKNVGLEALEDVAGSVLKTPAELIAAAPYIQTGFGSEVSGADLSAAVGMKTKKGGIIDWSKCITDYPDDASHCGEMMGSEGETEGHSQEDLEKIRLRRQAHLQYMGTAGVARADMGATVARSEQAAFDRLSKYVGSGGGVTANVKVLTGLDLTLTQRINMLNMLLGQEVSTEAAIALQYLEE